MYKCNKAFKSQAGVKYRDGEEITSHQYANMAISDKTHFIDKKAKGSGNAPEMPVAGSNAEKNSSKTDNFSDLDMADDKYQDFDDE